MYRVVILVILSIASSGCARRTSDLTPQETSLSEVSLPAPSFLRQVSSTPLVLASEPSLWPADVQAGVAQLLGQPRLFIAAPGGPADLGCNPNPSLPRHRLIAAAIGPQYAVVQIEAGGFAVVSELSVLARGSAQATRLWAQPGLRSLTPVSLLPAIRSGSLWAGSAPSLSAKAGT